MPTALDAPAPAPPARPRLAREMGLLGLIATGVCSMVGAGINVIPFMIQRHVPGIGPHVLPAFALAAVPAVLAGLAYAMLASAMPRAGGSYVYASRGLSPYLGFVASFSQWFSLCVAIGVVAYLITPFLRDIAVAAGAPAAAAALEGGAVRLAVSLAMLWAAAAVNLRGVKAYERLIVPLMFLTFALGLVVIVAGFAFDHAQFAAALAARGVTPVAPSPPMPLTSGVLVTAAALLFASFIGFDSIAQAGGEARDPGRTLPLAIGLAVGSVGVFYMLFTAAVYHAVPWQYVAAEAAVRDLTAPGLLGYLLPPFWTVVIVAAAAVALVKDLPAMLLAVSRLMFAWAEDGIFPRAVSAVHPRFRTPHVAIVASAVMATAGVMGSHVAGDFFLGVDILVTSMLVNFLVMTLAVLALPSRNPRLARAVTVLPSRAVQAPLAALGAMVIAAFLAVHTWRDLTAPAAAWYFRSTPVWLLVMAAGSLIYLREVRALRRQGVDVAVRFAELPPGMSMPSSVERLTLAPGLSISRVLTGLWQMADQERDGRAVDLDAAARSMAPYVEAGLTTFDMADHYGSSELVAGRFRAGWREPSAVQLCTKWVPTPGPVTRADVRQAVERALTRLRTDTLDLLQFHAWNYADPSWLDALFHLQDLKREGLLRHLGLTNVDAPHLDMVLASGVEVVANQVHFSLLDQRAAGALSAVCRARNVRLLAYGTVAGGWLSERWLGAAEPDWERTGTWSQMKYGRFLRVAGGWGALQRVLRAAKLVGDRHGVSIANVASRFILEQPAVGGVIIGARLGEREHIADTLALFSFALTDADRAELGAALATLQPIPGDCGDEYRTPPFLTASGDLSHHLDTLPAPYATRPGPDGRTLCLSGTPWEGFAGYSRATRRGARIHVSGTTATHGDRLIGGADAAAQMHFAIDKIAGALQSLGGRLEDVVRTRVFVKRIGDWEAVARAHGARFGHVQPANTLVSAGLVGDEYLVEVEADAEVDG